MNVQSIGQSLESNYFDTFQNHSHPDNTFVFDPGFGLDVVNQFRVNGVDHDTISLAGADFNNDIATVLHNTRNASGGVLISDPNSGDTVKLAGINKSQIVNNQSDFSFHV